jgi:hypothetical protein
MSKYFKIEINETGCDTPKDIDNSTMFNKIVETKKTIEEIEAYLKDRYGKTIPKAHREKRCVYIDKNDGSVERIGFLYSFWSKDWSHNSKSWFQTDWITVAQVVEKPVLI